jgi:hypothetical protein
MTRIRRRWKLLAIIGSIFVAAVVSGAVVLDLLYRSTERTYYGPRTNLLRVGERVALAEDFAPPGHSLIAKAEHGIVQKEPAWDEDSCDPDRPISIVLASGEPISVPRHLLHR